MVTPYCCTGEGNCEAACPSRIWVTEDGLVVMASEVGVLDIPPEDVLQKGRLAPGKMFLVDTAQKRIIYDNEVKAAISRRMPYRRWVEANRMADARELFRKDGVAEREQRVDGITRRAAMLSGSIASA